MTRTILAYLDPGSGSMIIQILLGGVAAAGVALKLYWRRFLRLLGIRKDDPVHDDDRDTGDAPVVAAAAADAEPQQPVRSGKS